MKSKCTVKSSICRPITLGYQWPKKGCPSLPETIADWGEKWVSVWGLPNLVSYVRWQGLQSVLNALARDQYKQDAWTEFAVKVPALTSPRKFDKPITQSKLLRTTSLDFWKTFSKMNHVTMSTPTLQGWLCQTQTPKEISTDKMRPQIFIPNPQLKSGWVFWKNVGVTGFEIPKTLPRILVILQPHLFCL